MTLYLPDANPSLGSNYPCQPGRCGYFDGVDDRVQMQKIDQTHLNGTLSFMAWVRFDDASNGGWWHPYRQATNWPYQVTMDGFCINTTGGGAGDITLRQLGVSIGDGVAAKNAYVNSGAWTTLEWMHIAGVYDGSDLILYINGYERVRTDVTGFAGFDASAHTGHYIATGPSARFQGRVFDIRTYGSTKSAEDIFNIWDSTRQPGRNPGEHIGTPVYHCWCEADTFLDRSGNGYDPTSIQGGVGVLETADVPCSLENEVGVSNFNVVNFPDTGNAWVDSSADILKGATNATAFIKYKPNDLVDGALAGEYYWDGHQCWLIFESGGSLDVIITQDGSTRKRYKIDTPPNVGQWMTYGWTFAPNDLKVYVNGVEAAVTKTNDNTVNSLYAGTTAQNELALGQTGSGSYLNGMLSDLQLFTRTLTAQEMADIHNNALADYSNLALRWRMDEGEGEPLDSSGNGNDGTLTGTAAWAVDAVINPAESYPGPLARTPVAVQSPCVTFDRVDDRIECGTSVPLATTAMTVTAWVNPTSSANKCISNRYVRSGNQRCWWWSVDAALSHAVKVFLSADGGNSNFKNYNTVPTLTPDTWSHVAFRFNANVLDLFIDGVQVDVTKVTDVTINSLHQTTAQVIIGNENGESDWFGGSMADHRQFNRALTDTEIADIAKGGGPTDADHWIPMCEGDGLTMHDASGNGNHGTMTGATSPNAWANTQDEYHHVAQHGHSPTLVDGRTFDGTQSFTGAEGQRSAMTPSGQDMWVYFYGQVAALSQGTQYLASRWDAGQSAREWGLYVNSSNQIAFFISQNGSYSAAWELNGSAVSATTDFSAGGYYDLSNTRQHVYLDGSETNTPQTTVVSPFAGVKLGVMGDSPASAQTNGIARRVVIGSGSDLGDMKTILDAIHNSGSPLSYSDLTEQQKTDWGLQAWYECDDAGNTLVDSHNANHLQVAGAFTDHPVPQIPVASAPTMPGGDRNSQALTKWDWTGGVAAPWKEKVSRGYYTSDATVNGISIDDVLGSVTANGFTVYAKLRGVTFTTTRTILDIKDISGSGDPQYRSAFSIRDTGQIALYTNGWFNSSTYFPTDGEWHEVVWRRQHGTTSWQVWLDGVQGSNGSGTSFTSDGVAVGNVLGNEPTGSAMDGDIARVIVCNSSEDATSILTANNILDLRFDDNMLYDIQGRIAPVASEVGRAYQKDTVPTSYLFGDVLPEMHEVQTRAGLHEQDLAIRKP